MHPPALHVRATLLLAAAFVLVITPRPAVAATYWVDLRADRGEIAEGVNGFGWIVAGGAFNHYGATCEARPGQTFTAGAHCSLRFTVPAGLAVVDGPSGGGAVRGTYRVANERFDLRTERPGAAPAYTTQVHAQTTAHGPFTHGWGALGASVQTGLVATAATTTGATMNTWFRADQFVAQLEDTTAPEFVGWGVAGVNADGWRGPGCHEAWYTFTDTGSQLWATSIEDRSSGDAVHAWTAKPDVTVVRSGIGSVTWPTCIPAPGSGSYTFRLAGTDRAGTSTVSDQTLRFDVTPPAVGAPQYSGSEVVDGRAFTGAAEGYRPGITWSVTDGHSGVSRASATVDGVAVPLTSTASTVTLAPAKNLTVGSHVLRLDAFDAVGNTRRVERRIVVADVAPPQVAVVQLDRSGGADALVELRGSDDATGVDPAGWQVLVDGAALELQRDGDRVRASIGRLVDGTHTVVVVAADRAGNVARRDLPLEVDADADVPQLVGAALTGTTVYGRPGPARAGSTHRVRAVFAVRGRPVGGRAELHDGTVTVAGKEIEANGSVNLGLTVDADATFTLHAPAGSGLAPVAIQVEVDETLPAVAAAAGSRAGRRDGVAPRWRLTIRPASPGTVRRTHRLVLSLWTDESAATTLAPVGARATVASTPGKAARRVVLSFDPGSPLGRRVAAARAGDVVRVRVRVVSVDRHHNRSVAQTVRLRVRV